MNHEQLDIKLVSTKEVANILGIHEKTIKRLLISGEMIGYKIKGQWRVDWDDVRAYLEKVKNT